MSANLELLCASSPLDDEEDLTAADIRQSDKPSPGLWGRIASWILSPRPHAGVNRVQASFRCA